MNDSVWTANGLELDIFHDKLWVPEDKKWFTGSLKFEVRSFRFRS